jgi:hypothetical protein
MIMEIRSRVIKQSSLPKPTTMSIAHDAAKIRFMRHHFNAYLTALDNQQGPQFFNHMTVLYFETFGYAPMDAHFDGTREDAPPLTVEMQLARQQLTKRVGQVSVRLVDFLPCADFISKFAHGIAPKIRFGEVLIK